jgi:hypothetical protein
LSEPLDFKKEHFDIFINDLKHICYSLGFIPYTARRCLKTPNVVESQKVCIALLFMKIDSEELNLILVIVQRGLRVESNLTLCGILNRDVCVFVALNFRNKSLSLISCSNLLL